MAGSVGVNIKKGRNHEDALVNVFSTVDVMIGLIFGFIRDTSKANKLEDFQDAGKDGGESAILVELKWFARYDLYKFKSLSVLHIVFFTWEELLRVPHRYELLPPVKRT
jgi:hypothetical protein